MSEEIAVVAIAVAKPGLEAEVEAAIRPCITETRKEAGCRLYTAHTQLDHPDRFVFIERWASLEALEAHKRAPHFLALVKALESRLAEPLQVLVLRALP